jgi:hypothetical protein
LIYGGFVLDSWWFCIDLWLFLWWTGGGFVVGFMVVVWWIYGGCVVELWWLCSGSMVVLKILTMCTL